MRLSSVDKTKIKLILEKLYQEYDFANRLKHDPVFFPHNYTAKKDKEVVAFIASAFAYGKVSLFFKTIEAVLERMKEHPWDFLKEFDPAKDGKLFKGIYYRLSKDGDIVRFLGGISMVLKQYESLEELFRRAEGESLKSRAQRFLQTIRTFSFRIPVHRQLQYSERGLLQLLPVIAGNSPAKRLNLFLRWMVRNRDIDLGLWKVLEPSALIIPLDTHIARISRCLNLTTRSTVSWAMAEEITETLKEFDPMDPLKYDFALCHEGITRHCQRLCGAQMQCPLKSNN